MNGGPRRRRVRESEPEERKAFPLVPLLIVVVLVGPAIGYLLSRYVGNQQTTTTTAVSVPTEVPTPQASASATGLQSTPSPDRAPRRSPPATASSPAVHATPHRVALSTPHPTPVVTTAPTVSPAATVTPAPKASPTATSQPTPVPRASRIVTPKPPTVAPKPAATPVASGGAAAAQRVRDYLGALIAGDPASANRALGRAPDNADFPEKQFIGRGSQITSVRTTPNRDGSFTVQTEIQSDGGGTYYCTFQTGRSDISQYFADHYCIKIN